MKALIIGKGVLTVVMIFSFAISSCKKDNTSTSSNNNKTLSANEVSIKDMAFSPSSLTVSAGTTVKFTNNDGVTHTVTSNTSVFDSGSLSAGNTYSFTFSTAGTYPYYCKIHTSMTGTIVVQ
jgi:plastocyanin